MEAAIAWQWKNIKMKNNEKVSYRRFLIQSVWDTAWQNTSLELKYHWYSVSHKVEISERFKSHRLEFKGQSSNLKHVEKIDEQKLNGENVDIQMSTLVNCTFLAFFERSLISTLWDRLY